MAQFIQCRVCRKNVNRFLEECPYCGSDPGGDRSDAPGTPISAAERQTKRHQIDAIGLFVRLLLGLVIVASLLRIGTAVPYRADLIDLANGVGGGALALVEDRFNVSAFISSILYVASAIAFVTWFWRAYSNLGALGKRRERKPGWAIGSWFIPIAGFIIPYGIGAEIWTKSEAQEDSVTAERNIEPVISWWALYLIMTLVNVVQALMLPPDYTTDDLVAFVAVDIISSVVTIAAAIAAIRYVLLATRRQQTLLDATPPSAVSL